MEEVVTISHFDILKIVKSVVKRTVERNFKVHRRFEERRYEVSWAVWPPSTTLYDQL